MVEGCGTLRTRASKVSIMETFDALHAFRSFRASFYESLNRRADALFELTDALLPCTEAVPSPVHLSLQASNRRGWGSLYAALAHGRADAEALRDLLLSHDPLAGGEEQSVYGHGRDRAAPL